MKNTRRLAVLATLAASAFAAQAGGFDFAGSNNYPPEAQSQGALTRAQVIADLQAAQANGTMPSVGEGYQPLQSTAQSTVSRDQVRQEAAAAERAGLLSYGG